MDAEKAIERIKMLLQRTEEKGASPAEEDTASRMVCKLLRQFPSLLKPPGNFRDYEQKRERNYRTPEPERYTSNNDKVSIPYTCVVRQTEKAILVIIRSKEIWLPLKQITLKVSTIIMPRWLAQVKELI